MLSINCGCGYKVEGKDHYETEAKAWHHAIKDHLEMLKGLNEKQIEEVLKNSDNQMGIKS